jgi:GT2 family glycosyltransferase
MDRRHSDSSDTLVPLQPGYHVGVVIPTRNRGALIAQTLQSILALDYPSFEVWVVDQSTDHLTRRTVEEVAGDDPRVHYHSTTTVGSALGRNIGAQLANAEIIAFTDDDCIVTQEWLDTIIEEFRSPTISAVYGQLLPYEYDHRTGIDAGLKDTADRIEYQGKTPPWYIGHGGNMAVRRVDLLEVGGFDPLLGAGARLRSNEDGDLTYRLLAAGKRLVYNPRALAYHKQWKPWHAQKAMERAYGIGAGAQFAKYLRCRDPYGGRLLATWIWQLGIRRLAAGLLKWGSAKVMYLGFCQLIYPWIGIWEARRFRVDRDRTSYVLPREALTPSMETEQISVM